MHKLRLLDGQEERFSYGLVITAYEVIRGDNKIMAKCNHKHEAKRIAEELKRKLPDRNFYVK